MSVILSLVVVLKFLRERGQAKHLMISGYWTKDMLFWEKGFAYFDRKGEKALDPFQSDMDHMGRPPEELGKVKRIKRDR